jgi:hypothetical protein
VQAVKHALASEASSLQALVPQGTHLEVTQADIEAPWGVLYTTERNDTDNSTVATEGLVLLLTKTASGTWALVSEASPGFCSALGRMPTNLIDASFKNHFIGC